MQQSGVPYFSQWETPGMTLPVLAEGSQALLGDPLWRHSGAATIEEYARWAVNVCGMACLKMILAARGEIHPTLELARACTAYGGYVVNEIDASIKGLIYAPFVRFAADRFGLSAETMTGVETSAIPELLVEAPVLHRLGELGHPLAGARAAVERRTPGAGDGSQRRDDPFPQPVRPRRCEPGRCDAAACRLRPFLRQSRHIGRRLTLFNTRSFRRLS